MDNKYSIEDAVQIAKGSGFGEAYTREEVTCLMNYAYEAALRQDENSLTLQIDKLKKENEQLKDATIRHHIAMTKGA